MARYRTYSIEIMRQVVQEYFGGEVSLLGLTKRHAICRIRLWLKKYQDDEFNEDATLAASMQEYEAKIAALERQLGELTMDNDALKQKRCHLPHQPNAARACSSTGLRRLRCTWMSNHGSDSQQC